jgi:hypothetical protein
MAGPDAPPQSDVTVMERGKKAIAVATMGISLFLSGEVEAAKKPRQAAAQPAAPGTEAAPPQEPGDAAEEALIKEQTRRNSIRDTLLAQAQKEYPSLLNGAQTSYSGDLEGLQRKVNHYLKTEGNRFHSQVVFIDPAKLDTGMAIGLTPSSAVGSILGAQGVNSDKATVDDAASKMTKAIFTKFGGITYTQDPTAFTNNQGGLQACVVVPSSDHALMEEANIPALSAQDRAKFINKHESWHCIDDQFTTRHLDQKELEKVNMNDLKSIANNKAASDLVAIQSQKEAFADAGAVGEMIREGGYDLRLLDSVSQWRKDRPADIIHLSTPVLEGMKKEINEMGGISKFREMDEKQAKEFYYQVVDKYGLTGKGFRAALKYETGNPLQKLGYKIDALGDSEVRRGLELRDYVNRTPGQTVAPTPTAAEVEQVRNYDAQAQLEQRAFENGRKITPVTMAQAYTQIQEELRAQMKAHPESMLYAEQMTKLQQSFTTNVKTMDYVEANSRFGVDIVKEDAALASFSEKQAPKAKAPAQMKPGS